ncbi:MAG TPA: Hsp20/alpha crystallin family protein [Thermodesulfovibrionales bacterium]|nr:Hsp20/alpha crystallin family protein [Thermodesulfovibrionales bacterium]
MPKKTPAPSKQAVPVRKQETNPFADFRTEMNSLFDNFFRGFEMEPSWARLGAFNPKIDVKESAKEISISAELPGLDDKDVVVSLTKDTVTITGEKKQEKESKGKDFYRMERSYGSFSRTIPLPSEIDPDKVKAEFKKGILSISLPKTAKAIKDMKKISVKAE